MASYNYVYNPTTKKILFKSNDFEKVKAYRNKAEKETGNKNLEIRLHSDYLNGMLSKMLG